MLDLSNLNFYRGYRLLRREDGIEFEHIEFEHVAAEEVDIRRGFIPAKNLLNGLGLAVSKIDEIEDTFPL